MAFTGNSLLLLLCLRGVVSTLSRFCVRCRLPVITGLKGMGKILPSLLRSSLLKEVVMADSLGTLQRHDTTRHDQRPTTRNELTYLCACDAERGFWYVGFLAVDPDCQGQGVGSVLLQYLSSRSSPFL